MISCCYYYNIQLEAGRRKGFDRHTIKSILKGVSVYFNPGRMVGIMGPSGCGKTTFLDLLTGRRKAGIIKVGQDDVILNYFRTPFYVKNVKIVYVVVCYSILYVSLASWTLPPLPFYMPRFICKGGGSSNSCHIPCVALYYHIRPVWFALLVWYVNNDVMS